MLRLPVIAVFAALAASPASAAQRFNCAADDANLKLSLDVVVDDKGIRPVTHFRGALITKQQGIPDGFHRLLLDSTQLVHYWAYDDELRLEIFGKGENDDADKSFDLIIKADRKAATGPVAGSYLLAFTAGGAKSLQVKGSIGCAVK